MKMTREQVADLLLKADLDCRNLEYLDNGEWKPTLKNYIGHILQNIVNGYIYRIKDNAVKEVTPALRGKWAIYKFNKDEFPIGGLNLEKQKIKINGSWFTVEQFNELYELVED